MRETQSELDEYIKYARSFFRDLPEQPTKGQRKRAYEKARTTLIRQDEIEGASERQGKRRQALLNLAIDEIETGYLITKAEGAFDFVEALNLKYFGFVIVLTAVADFLKFLGEYQVWVFAGSAVIFIALVLLSRSSPAVKLQTKEARAFSGLLAAGSSIWLVAQALVPNANATGVAGATIPGVANAQNEILLRLGRIEQLNQRQVESLDRIEKTLTNVKKETSDDPDKELVNLGHINKRDAWDVAFRDADVRILNLLHEAKFFPRSNQYSVILATLQRDGQWRKSAAFLQALRKYKMEIAENICVTPWNNLYQLAKADEHIGTVELKFYCPQMAKYLLEVKRQIDAEWEKICREYIASRSELRSVSCALDQISEFGKAANLLERGRHGLFYTYRDYSVARRAIETLRNRLEIL